MEEEVKNDQFPPHVKETDICEKYINKIIGFSLLILFFPSKKEINILSYFSNLKTKNVVFVNTSLPIEFIVMETNFIDSTILCDSF